MTCENCAFAGRPAYKSPCSECIGFDKWEEKEKPITNADHIRSMSDEELMKFFCKKILIKKFLTDACYKICPVKMQCFPGHNGILEWLKQPYKEDADG